MPQAQPVEINQELLQGFIRSYVQEYLKSALEEPFDIKGKGA
jgi:hypothetical protein